MFVEDESDAPFELGRRGDDGLGGDADAAVLVGRLDDGRENVPSVGSRRAKDGPGRGGQIPFIEDALDLRLVVGQGQHVGRRARENEAQPLQDRGHLRFAAGDAGELLAPVEHDVIPGIVGFEPTGEAFVFDGQEFDLMAKPRQRVAEHRDILFGFPAFLRSPVGTHVVEQEDRQIATEAIHSRLELLSLFYGRMMRT